MPEKDRVFLAGRVSTGRISILYRLCTLLLLLCMLVITGCHGSTDGYRNVTVRNNIGNFSFEYRSFYEIEGPDIEDDAYFRFTYVQLLAPKRNMPMVIPDDSGKNPETYPVEYVPASIEVMASDASKHPASAETRLEDALSSWSKWPHFELLERTAVTVSGIQGELIAYYIDWLLPVPKQEGDEPLLRYKVEVYFDYAELKWDMKAESDMDMAEMVRADFDHVLQTFKILD